MSQAIFDPIATHYDSWYATELGHLVDHLERKLAKSMFQPNGKRILEVGSGTGLYTVRLAQEGYEITAVDISAEMTSLAQTKMLELGLQAEWLVADITEVLPRLGKFHGIFSLTAFEFIPDPEKVLQELYRHLEPGGCMVIGVIAGGSPWGDFYMQTARDNPDSVFNYATFYTEAEIRNWRINSHAEIGQALYFPPNIEMLGQARKMEEEKSSEAGFLVAKWVKV
ncbi:MAG TPA: class I SAM-dependent methyltransferase [Desulfitobacteriaceae bacterium]|nr:class I SAM-dependent methyltransferase [Desulfitobacteriaceae bacterium]